MTSQKQPTLDAELCGYLMHAYRRGEAILDGVLVDVSQAAKEAGFLMPVAVTRGVWVKCVEVPDQPSCQDEAGRLWDVLSVLSASIRRRRGKADSAFGIEFDLDVQRSETRRDSVKLRSTCGPGDDGEPVITIMLQGED